MVESCRFDSGEGDPTKRLTRDLADCERAISLQNSLVSRPKSFGPLDESLEVDALVSTPEGQYFDRKSARIEPRALADSMIGFANADGGRIVVGIYNGRFEQLENEGRVNELLQAALDYTQPPVRHVGRPVEWTDAEGRSNRLLIFDIESSATVHRNRRGECFLRVGDENRRLQGSEERELVYDKGDSHYDATLVEGLTLSDLDADAVSLYARRVGVEDTKRLLRARGLVADRMGTVGVTQAGWLVFGAEPPVWSYVRYLRYSGTTAETGVRSNVLDDVRLEGSIPSLIEQSKALLSEKIGTVVRLAPNGRFERMPLLPEFVWLEAIVNALTHRSYSLQGDGIRVRDFEDRLEVESPGRLPGLVRVQNIRTTRFSRNPHIARVLAEATRYVREMNEGVERMYEEMSLSGLREPRFTVGDGSFKVTLYKHPDDESRTRRQRVAMRLDLLRQQVGDDRLDALLSRLKIAGKLRPSQIAETLGVSLPTVRKYMGWLEDAGIVMQVKRSTNDPNRVWAVASTPFWEEFSSSEKSADRFK